MPEARGQILTTSLVELTTYPALTTIWNAIVTRCYAMGQIFAAEGLTKEETLLRLIVSLLLNPYNYSVTRMNLCMTRWSELLRLLKTRTMITTTTDVTINIGPGEVRQLMSAVNWIRARIKYTKAAFQLRFHPESHRVRRSARQKTVV